MDNATVIADLKRIIAALEARLVELQALQNAPGGPLEERVDRQNQVLSQIGSLNLRLAHLQTRLHDRELAQEAGTAVPPLAPEKREAMQAALAKVNEAIVATRTFQDMIKLAEEISKAASAAGSAV